MKKLVLIDGNSILNRAFYGTMGTKIMMTEDRNIYKCNIWFSEHNV